jgi:hypothetical protein
MVSLISPQSLKDLVDANAIRDARVVAERNVYKVVVKYGTAERLVSVRARNGQTKERLFKSIDSAGRFLRDSAHIVHYQVDASNFDAAATERKRPDAAVRLKNAHAALTHTEWLMEKVAASRAGLLDGSNKVYTDDEWAKIRADKVAARKAVSA